MPLRTLDPTDTDTMAMVLDLNNAHVPAVSEVDADHLEQLVQWSSVSLVAEHDGAFAGFCIVLPPGRPYDSLNYRWFSAEAAGLGYDTFAYLDRIAIAETAQRTGLGRAMYGELRDRLGGVTPVLFCEVNVKPRNERSLVFHDAIGFREVGQQDTDPGKRVSLLALDLTA